MKKSLFLLLIVFGLSMITSCGGGGGGSSSGGSGSGSPTFTISGEVMLNGTGLLGVTMALTGAAATSTTTDSRGNYSVNVAIGNYIITPSLSGYTFSPANSSQTVISSNITGVNFTASGSTAVVTTLAGNGTATFANGTGVSATFYYPGGITIHGTNVYVADTYNNAIRIIAIATGQVTTLAGNGTAGFTNGIGSSATFYYPFSITTDGTNLYVADRDNNAIRIIVIATGQVTTLAGNGTAGFTNGIGSLATFDDPYGITTDGTNLYVTDEGNSAIRKIVIATGQVTTLAGNGTAGFTNGTGSSATFDDPFGITTDGTNLYVTDAYNNAIRKIVIATGQVTTLAGNGTAGSTNGAGSSATFYYPRGITTDGTNLYVADTNNNAIRMIAIATGQVTTLAGNGTAGFTSGTGSTGTFYFPGGITTDGTNLYVTDEGNNAIRKIQLQ